LLQGAEEEDVRSMHDEIALSILRHLAPGHAIVFFSLSLLMFVCVCVPQQDFQVELLFSNSPSLLTTSKSKAQVEKNSGEENTTRPQPAENKVMLAIKKVQRKCLISSGMMLGKTGLHHQGPKLTSPGRE
jgi:hypothetical protein